MRYFMHKNFEIPFALTKDIRKHFSKVQTVETTVSLKDKEYKALVDVESFLHLTNFDCFNCLTNCCVQFPYEFNEKAREVILENLDQYDELTKAVSILKEEGMSQDEIRDSIKNDPMLIPHEHVKKTFDRCTCSCTYIDKKLCAIHKICLDKNMTLSKIIDTKPLWCSIYPLEIISENDESLLYIFVPTKTTDFMAMNDTNFPCMNIEMSKSAKFRRENPLGFKESEYIPFINSYESVLKYILGKPFLQSVKKSLNLKEINDKKNQYEKTF